VNIGDWRYILVEVEKFKLHVIIVGCIGCIKAWRFGSALVA
jgi:hypothetical protein